MILRIYRALARTYGPLYWWPARTRFEVIVGAFLTQNTNWKNVERALENLKRAKKLNVAGIRQTSIPDLESLLRPSGYYRQKAERLKTFVAYLDQRFGGSLTQMFSESPELLRSELLELKGVGPETADAILLYAGKLPVFVVDAYTKRIFERHGIIPAGSKYEDLRKQVEAVFRSRYSKAEIADHFNEFHALLVQVGKNHCGTVPRCEGCPLQRLLPSKQLAFPS